jgi:hypothetical protein
VKFQRHYFLPVGVLMAASFVEGTYASERLVC